MKQTPAYAKITKPEVRDVYSRTRLFRRLDQAKKRPVIYVCAPPGSGKTTLIASYLTDRKLPCLWYQIDEGDGDIASFFHYMAIAAKQANPRKKKPLPNLTPEYLLGLPTFTRNYFRELYSRLNPSVSPLTSPIPSLPRRGERGGKSGVSKGGFAIVLDNYQDAPANSPLHEIIQTGLSEIPEGINVIIISRVQPPDAMARIQASNNFTMLRWDDLKLTEEESIGIAKLRHTVSLLKRSGRKFSQELLHAIHEQTQGWVAGLVLMLEQYKEMAIPKEITNQGTHEAVFNYFAGEIFQRTDKDTHEFLLKTAYLPEMTAQMAKQLTGQQDAGEMLDGLSHSNYFTIRRLHPEPIYQYHPLFREFLLSHSRNLLSNEDISQIQRGAALILERAGQTEDAIELLLKSSDWPEVSRLICQSAPMLFAQGRGQTVKGWLTSLPEEMLKDSPWLLYWLGFCLLPFDFKKSRLHSERAFELFRIRKDVSGIFLSWSLIVEALLHELSNLKELDQWLLLFDELLHSYETLPSEAIEAQVAPKLFLSLVMRNPEHPEFNKWKERTHTVLEKGIDATLRMFAGFYLLTYYLWIGEYARSAHILAILRAIAKAERASPLAQITVKMAESWYQWLSGLFEPSLKTMSNALEIGMESGVHIWDYLLMIQGVAASLSVGNLLTADGLLKKMSSVLDRVRRFDRFYYHHEMAWHSILSNDISAALMHEENALSLAKDVGVLFIEAQAYLGMAQVMHMQAGHKKAEEYLLQAQDIGRRMGSKSIEFACLLAEARFAIDLGNDEKGIKFLSDAMTLGKKQGYVNFSWWQDTVMSQLCAKALEHNIEADYVRDLIRKRNLLPLEDGRGLENWPWPLKIYTMGRFAILKDEKPIKFTKKAQNKPIELLKALIALGGRDVLEEQLTDVLYPQADGDAAHIALATTLKRLRQLIEYKEAIELKEGHLTLNPAYVWVDNWAFERLCSQADAILKRIGESEKGGSGDITASLNEAIRVIEKAISIYSGHFLNKDEEPCAVSLRERLRSKFMRHTQEIGEYFENAGQWENAAEYYQKAIDVDDLEETFYQRLMLAYQRLGRPNDAINVYQRCLKTLTAVGMRPSPKTEEIYRKIANCGLKI